MKVLVVRLILASLLVIIFPRGNKSSKMLDYDEMLNIVIKEVDLNEDSYIDLEEYRMVTKTNVESLPSKFDTDGDGKYNFEEYKKELADSIKKSLFE